MEQQRLHKKIKHVFVFGWWWKSYHSCSHEVMEDLDIKCVNQSFSLCREFPRNSNHPNTSSASQQASLKACFLSDDVSPRLQWRSFIKKCSSDEAVLTYSTFPSQALQTCPSSGPPFLLRHPGLFLRPPLSSMNCCWVVGAAERPACSPCPLRRFHIVSLEFLDRSCPYTAASTGSVGYTSTPCYRTSSISFWRWTS